MAAGSIPAKGTNKERNIVKKIRVVGDSHTSKISYLIQDYFREQDEEHEFRDSDNEMTKNYYKVFKNSWFDGRMYIEADKKIFLR